MCDVVALDQVNVIAADMVHYFSGSGAPNPMINIYCDGFRVATYGPQPNPVTSFNSSGGFNCSGHTWRVADVTVNINGGVTTCTVDAINPPGLNSGYHVRNDDTQYD